MAEKKAGAKKKATSAKKSAAGAKKKASSSPRAAMKSRPTHEAIAKRAYEIHEREGGHPEENWLRAERELEGS
jgi:Protein of unknown function (DUF2934)